MLINPIHIVALLSVTFNPERLEINPLEVNQDERFVADVIEKIIRQSIDNSYMDVESEMSLSFDNDDSDISPQTTDYIEDYNEDFAEVPACLYKEESVNYDYKKQAVEYWQSGKRGPLSYDSVKSKFRKLTSDRQLRRWKQQVESGGDRQDRLYQITQYTLEKFKEAIASKIIIHDIDLKRWALKKKAELKISWFKASRWWLNEFKKKHGIVSRKITKFVTKRSINNNKELEMQCSVFQNSVKQLIMERGVQNIYNSDQSGFNLEFHSGRTLQCQGSKNVESVVQSLSSLTHSYTVQPTISADGKLLSPLFLVLKETTGEFGPRVLKNLFQPSNVYLEASKSGKLTKELFQTWLTNVFLPHAGNSPVLLLDSWSGQCDSAVQEVLPKENNFKLMTIPKGTTDKIQPLDVYTFRLWKDFDRKLSDIVLLYNYDVKLNERNNIIKMQSLTHNQFSSPRFENVFKYAWHKAGYLDGRPSEFEVPGKFCFQTEEEPICDICGDIAVIRCGWCKKQLCFKHFFTNYHFCKKYEP